MKRLILIFSILFICGAAIAQKQTIANGESGLSVRTKMNTMFGQLYDNNINIGFSANGSSWHDNYSSGDVYFRISRDQGTSWGESVPIGQDSVSAQTQTVYTITLPSSTTVAGRCSGAALGTDYPTGWTVAAGTSAVDLKITHGLGRRIVYVSVFSVSGSAERQLFNNAAYSGIYAETSSILRIESLATIQTPIVIQMVFAQ